VTPANTEAPETDNEPSEAVPTAENGPLTISLPSTAILLAWTAPAVTPANTEAPETDNEPSEDVPTAENGPLTISLPSTTMLPAWTAPAVTPANTEAPETDNEPNEAAPTTDNFPAITGFWTKSNVTKPLAELIDKLLLGPACRVLKLACQEPC